MANTAQDETVCYTCHHASTTIHTAQLYKICWIGESSVIRQAETIQISYYNNINNLLADLFIH